MRYISVDIETTGLNHDTCDILEFGAVIDDLKCIQPIKSLPKYHCYFLLPNYIGEPYALSMHSVIFKRIAEKEKGFTYVNPMKFGYSFKQFLIKNGFESKSDRVTINVAGKNFGAFDLQFLNKKTDLNKHVKIRHKILDPAILYLKGSDIALPGMEDCKLRAGLSKEVAHNAIDDAIDVVKLIRNELKYKF